VAFSALMTPAGMAMADNSTVPAGSTAAGSSGFTVTVSDVSELSGMTARVTVDGDGLVLRSEPSDDSAAVTTLSDRTIVNLRIDVLDTVHDADGTRWWPVEVGGDTGWVSGSYLTETGADASDGTGAPLFKGSGPATTSASSTGTMPAFTWKGSDLAGATAVVSAEGDNLILRAEPIAEADSLADIPDGTVVDLRIDMVDTVEDADGVTRWWPVTYEDQQGWVSGFYLSDGSASPSSTTTTTTTGTDGTSGSTTTVATERVAFEWDGGELVGATAVVVAGGNGGSVYSEPSAGSGVVTTVINGTTVNLRIAAVDTVMDADGETRWWPVEVNGAVGWISGFNLTGSESDDLSPSSLTAAMMEAEGQTIPGESVVVTPTPVPVTPAPTEPAAENAQTAQVTPESRPTVSDVPDQTSDDAPESQDELEEVAETQTPAPTPVETPEPQPEGPMFIVPVENATLTQGFGCSSLGFYPYNPDWGCGVHDGIDYAAPTGTPILASAAGTVLFSGWCDCGLGYYVELDHGNGVTTIYGHMASQPFVSTGQQVAQGETIGPIGSTGLSTGPHVHFMLQINGVSQDPARYLG
jgi:murein DD-endopeptidase MepM/ murein hydrolase activator NlpD/uncharacterized protein YgiM (DUF1202 family)